MNKENNSQSIILRLSNLFQSIENKNLSLSIWVKTYLFIVFTRIMFESVISFPGHLIGFSVDPYFSLIRLISYIIYIVAISFPVILLLYFITKEKVVKITKTVILFTTISWVLPVLDFIFSLGKGCNMKYPHSFDQVLKALVNFFNPFCDFSDWWSAGLRIELFLVVFSMGIYSFIKTNSLKKGLIGFFSGYFWIFFLGLPLYAGCFIDMLHLPNVKKLNGYSEVYVNGGFVNEVISKIGITWLIVIIFLLPIWFFIHNKRYLFVLIKNIRLTRSIHYIILLLSGVIIGYNQFEPLFQNLFCYAFDYIAVLSLMFSIFFAFQYTVINNDICDFKIDQISNKTRPLVKNEISESEYRNFGSVYLILSLLFAFMVSHWAFLLTCLILSLCWIYSNPPLHLKKYFPVSTFLIALISLLVMLTGYSLISGSEHFYQFPPAMALVVLLSFFLAINIKDLKDFSGDKKGEIYTIPTMFGEVRGKLIVGFMALLAFIIPVVILQIKDLIPWSILCGIIAFILVILQKWKENLFFINYYCFFIIMMNFFIKSYPFQIQ